MLEDNRRYLYESTLQVLVCDEVGFVEVRFVDEAWLAGAAWFV